MANRSYIAFYGDDDNFDVPHPTMADIDNNFGMAAAVTNGQLMVRASERHELSPTAVALMMNGDHHHIHILHRPTFVRAGPGMGTYLALLGTEELAIDYVPLDADMFQVLPQKTVRTAADTAALLAAGANFAPSLAIGDPGAIAPIEARRAVVLPAQWVARGLNTVRFTHLEFYQAFLEPVITAAVAATVAEHQPWIDWWNYTSTAAAPAVVGGPDAPNSAQVAAAGPATTLDAIQLRQWVNRRVIREDLLHVSPPLPPGAVTGAVVQNAVGLLNTTLTDQENARVTREHAKANRTVTDRYGDHIANLLQVTCLVDSDDLLPEIHRLLARNSESARDSILLEGALLQARGASLLPVAEGNSVQVTRHLVQLFRSHQVYSDGVVFGEGLSPFAIICKGHPNAAEAKRSLEDAGQVERGASLSLADARAMAVSDARMPTMLQHLVDKLYGYSQVCDTYFGRIHPMAVALRSACIQLGPAITSLATYFGSPSSALRMGIRVVFYVQQLVFRWLKVRRTTPAGTDVPIPDFEGLVSDVGSFLLAGIPELPSSWQNMVLEENNVGPPEPDTRRLRGGADTGAEATVHNANVPEDIKRRWEATRFTRTSQMTSQFQPDSEFATLGSAIPKFSDGKQICLNWAIKGKCSSACPRKDSHRAMGVTLVAATKKLMDRCQVARA